MLTLGLAALGFAKTHRGEYEYARTIADEAVEICLETACVFTAPRHALLRAVTVENHVVRRRSVCEAGAPIGRSVRCQRPEGHVGDGRANGRARGSVGSQIRASRTARSCTA